MAEYSTEYSELMDIPFGHDFSVKDIFSKLKEGQSTEIICEGFGFHRITKTNEQCWITLREKTILFDEHFEQIKIQEQK